MLSLKPGIKIYGIKPEILLGLIIIERVFDSLNIPCVVTSPANNSEAHSSTNSLHYTGQAIDIRLPSRYNPSAGLDKSVTDSIRNVLGEEFDVVLESNHIHVEYQPHVVKLTEET